MPPTELVPYHNKEFVPLAVAVSALVGTFWQKLIGVVIIGALGVELIFTLKLWFEETQVVVEFFTEIANW